MDIANKKLKENGLAHEGIVVLGLQREKGNDIGTSGGKTKVLPKGRRIINGKASLLKAITAEKKPTNKEIGNTNQPFQNINKWQKRTTGRQQSAINTTEVYKITARPTKRQRSKFKTYAW